MSYRNNEKANVDVVMNKSNNFSFVERGALTSAELDADDTYLDERMQMISVNTDFKGMQWLLNYIETASYFAVRNKEAYPTYLCDLGYIPVVYMPTCASPTLAVKMMLALDQREIPYVKVRGTSFARKYFSTDIVDAWVHKTDAAKVLNCKPEDVRAVDFVREVFSFG